MQSSKTKRYLTDIVNDIFKESLSVSKKKVLEADDASAASGGDSNADKTFDDKIIDKKEAEKLKKGDITVDDVVEKLNAIRAGKSYKDEEILSKLTNYVDSLDKPEKVALLAFLKALTQIVTGEVPSKDVIKPSQNPIDVKMEKEPSGQKKTIKPTVIKKQSPEEIEKKTPAEDTKGPVPIVAKKK